MLSYMRITHIDSSQSIKNGVHEEAPYWAKHQQNLKVLILSDVLAQRCYNTWYFISITVRELTAVLSIIRTLFWRPRKMRSGLHIANFSRKNRLEWSTGRSIFEPKDEKLHFCSCLSCVGGYRLFGERAHRLLSTSIPVGLLRCALAST